MKPTPNLALLKQIEECLPVYVSHHIPPDLSHHLHKLERDTGLVRLVLAIFLVSETGEQYSPSPMTISVDHQFVAGVGVFQQT